MAYVSSQCAVQVRDCPDFSSLCEILCLAPFLWLLTLRRSEEGTILYLEAAVFIAHFALANDSGIQICLLTCRALRYELNEDSF